MRTEPIEDSDRRPTSGVGRPSEKSPAQEGSNGAAADMAVASEFSTVLQRIHAAASETELAHEAESGLARLAELVLERRHLDELQRLIGAHREQRRARLRPGRRRKTAANTEEPAHVVPNHLELGLSLREAEVLGWIARGKRDAEIAKILGISVRTVGKHVENLLRKLHVESRSAAVAAVRKR